MRLITSNQSPASSNGVIMFTGGDYVYWRITNQVTVFASVFQKCDLCHMNGTLVFCFVEKLLAKEHRFNL